MKSYKLTVISTSLMFKCTELVADQFDNRKHYKYWDNEVSSFLDQMIAPTADLFIMMLPQQAFITMATIFL